MMTPRHFLIHPTPIAVLALLVILPVSIVTAGETGPFVSMSFDQTCATAKKEKKAVFIDFYTTWCGPCQMLDKTTFKDPEVIAWLSQKTIPLAIDAEKEMALARRYRIEVFPTLLFLKPDGGEMDRLTGYLSAKEFLEQADAIMSGKDALTRAKEKLLAAGENDPMARMNYARVLARKGKHDEALRHFLWCYDEGIKHSISFYGVRLSFLLHDIANLGKHYPPAWGALSERRDQAREQILAGKGSHTTAAELEALNKRLGAPENTLALYDKLKVEHPDWEIITYLRDQVFDLLREKHRYAEIDATVDIQAKVDSQFEAHKPNWFTKLFRSWKYTKQRRERMSTMDQHMLIRNVAPYYEVLIGVGKVDEAAKLADRLLKVDDSANVYNALAWHGYLTRQPIAANLDQAQKACDLTGGQDATIIDTLARVLDAMGQNEQARNVLHKALQEIHSRHGQSILRSCLADLTGSGPSTVPGWLAYQQAWKNLDQGFANILIAVGPLVLLVILVVLAWRRFRRLQERNPPDEHESPDIIEPDDPPNDSVIS